jgi:3-oxoacyl-[acyl-carrier-protein] synthase-3
MGVQIVGLGHRMPDNHQSNQELCMHLDVTPDWIEQKTGITGRQIARDDEEVLDFAVSAAINAIQSSKSQIAEIDLIIVCTFSNDYVFPPLAVRVQQKLGIKSAHSFDVQANCAGFVSGLTIAAERLHCDPTLRYALVIGAEFSSRYIDIADRETSIFHSDGAGAAILTCNDDAGYLTSAFGSDVENVESVRLRGGGASFRNLEKLSSDRSSWYMEMNGLATWRQAITHLPRVVRNVCEKASIDISEVDKFIFHQANLRLIEYLVRKLKRDMSATYTNVERVGNSGAASIPIVLSEAHLNGFLCEGDLVCIAGIGAGFTFGASLWRWGSMNSRDEDSII